MYYYQLTFLGIIDYDIWNMDLEDVYGIDVIDVVIDPLYKANAKQLTHTSLLEMYYLAESFRVYSSYVYYD